MTMDTETQCLLSVLGFQDGMECLPQMKTLTTQFRRRSLIVHPDRPGGVKETFQELLDAFQRVGNLISNTEQTDQEDDEETKARKTFKEFNFAKKNTFSFTIFIQSNEFESWEEVLTEKCGEPIDRTDDNNGKQWTFEGHEVDDHPVSKMSITLWHKQNSVSSTMLIQA